MTATTAFMQPISKKGAAGPTESNNLPPTPDAMKIPTAPHMLNIPTTEPRFRRVLRG